MKSRTALWKPVLDGSLAEEAREAVAQISSELIATPGDAWDDPGLIRGAAGVSILYSYLEQCKLDHRAGEAARHFLLRARELAVSRPGPLSLFQGLAGVGAAAHILACATGEPEAVKIRRSVDEVIRRSLAARPWKGSFDLLSGILGLGVGASMDVDEPGRREIMNSVIDQLEGQSELTPQGRCWREKPERMSLEARTEFPAGYFDLGVAHGTPGVVIFLSRCVEHDIRETDARRMIQEAIPWLVAQRRPERIPPRYRNYLVPGRAPWEEGRIAWCHGDVSVAYSLIVAGRVLEQPSWKEDGVVLALEGANCPDSRNGITDTGLCHGAAGVAHMLNRLGQETGDARFFDAAIRWFERALRMRRPLEKVAGFPMRTGSDRDSAWRAEPSLLIGVAGVALALAAGQSTVPPNWDQLLLLS